MCKREKKLELLHTKVKWIIASNKEKHILAVRIAHHSKFAPIWIGFVESFLRINGFYDKILQAS